MTGVTLRLWREVFQGWGRRGQGLQAQLPHAAERQPWHRVGELAAWAEVAGSSWIARGGEWTGEFCIRAGYIFAPHAISLPHTHAIIFLICFLEQNA